MADAYRTKAGGRAGVPATIVWASGTQHQKQCQATVANCSLPAIRVGRGARGRRPEPPKLIESRITRIRREAPNSPNSAELQGAQ